MAALQSKTSVPPSNSDSDSSNSPMVIALNVLESDPEIENSKSGEDVHDIFPIQDHTDADNHRDTSAVLFLDVTDEDVNDEHMESILNTIKRLTADAKKYKSFELLFHLNTLEQFIEIWKKYQHNPKIKGPKRNMSRTIAISIRRGQYFAWRLCSMYTYVEHYHTLPPKGKGKHHAYPTLLNNEQIAAAVHQYLTVLANGELTKLGYELKEVKKGIYVDGHKQENVIAYWNKFLKEFGENESDDDLEPIEPNLDLGELLHQMIFHVKFGSMMERCHCERRVKGEQFICQTSLSNKAGNSLYPLYKSKRIPGIQKASSYQQQMFVRLYIQVKWAIQIFERIYSNTVTKFMFDQSSVHGAFTKDVLNAKDMNVQPGGKQCNMHDTWIPADNPNPSLRGDLPPSHPDYKFHGQLKGMQCILEECGLLIMLEAANNDKVVEECATCKMSRKALDQLLHEAQVAANKPLEEAGNAVLQVDSNHTDCCMRKMVASQQDF
ncbi:hypothetical protein HD554DRAFT_2040926 [Boletus coccyginus]|nr:hypothetical protein HD554DRAFT_2040926 [Boletus coccyginus]